MKKLFTLLIMAILATATSFAETKTGSWDLTTASDDWEATGNATYFSQPYGYKAANGTLTNSAISDFSTSGITQIKVGFKCLQNGGTTSKITIYLVDSEGKPLGNGMVVTPKNASAASQTAYSYATFTSGLTGATGFMMKVTTFGKNILVNGAEYEVTYGQQKQDPNISFSSSTHIAEIGKTNTFPTLTNSNNVPVTYSSSNTNVATIDPSTGAITLLSDGSTTIKASFSGDDTYSSAETSYTLLVRDNTVTPDVAQTIALNNAFWGTSYSDTFNPPANSLVLTGSKYGVAISLANGSSTAGYINDAQTRAYNGYTMSFTAPEGYVLKKITFTADGSNWQGEHTADAGSMTDNKHWLGSASAVTISFKGSCRIVSVDVTYEKASAPTPVTLASIAVSDPKTAFTVGDTFEFGGVVTATYDDGNTKDVTTDATFSGYDMASAGTQTVTVSYTEGEVTKTTTYDITVSAPVTLVSIAVSGTPTKKEYKDGDAFDPEGLVVTGTYSDASTAPITEGIEWTITPATLTAGTTSVSVVAKAGEKTSEEYTVTGLTVTEKPISSGVKIVWNDNGSDASTAVTEQTLKEYTIEGLGNVSSYSSIANVFKGTTGLKFSSSKNSGVMTINLASGQNANAIKLNAKQYGSSSLEGSFTVTTNGTEYNVALSGGEYAEYTIDLNSNETVSSVTIAATQRAYLKSIEFVESAPKTLESIAILGTPSTTTYTVGDTFNKTGLTVTATYDDESSKDVTASATWEINPATFSAAGENVEVTVKATYEGKEDSKTYSVTVKEPVTLSSITISGTPTKTAYKVGETFSAAGLKVNAVYSDESSKEVTATWSFEPATFSAAGPVKATATYTEGDATKTAYTTFDVTEVQKYTYTWYVNGAVYGDVQTLYKGEAVTKPADPATPEALTGKVFTGWVTSSTVDAESEPTYVTIDETAKANKNYYAVFATKKQEGGGEAYYEKVPYTNTEWAGGEYLLVYEDPAPATTGKVFNGLPSSNTNFVADVAIADNKISAKPEGAVVISYEKPEGKNFYGLRIQNTNNWLMSKGGNNGLNITTFELTTDMSYANTVISYNTTNDRWDIKIYDTYLSFSTDFRAGKTQTTFNPIQFYVKKAGTVDVYSEWTTGAEVVLRTLVSIALSGEYPTVFEVGDRFSHEGMVVTATYDDATTKVVTTKAVFEVNMAQVGEQTVTVSYTEGEVTKTATYTITIKKKSARAYTLVTSQDDIVDGGEYIILSEDGNYAAAVGTNKRIETEARGENTYKIVDNTVIVSSYSITRPYFLVATDGGWYLNDGEYNASVTNDKETPTYIDFEDGKQDVFTIRVCENDTVHITAPLVNPKRQIEYHYWTNKEGVVLRAFRYYASSNIGKADYQGIKLYKRVNTVVIEDGYRSKYNESTERNLYKNTLTYDVPKANDVLKLYRGTTLLGTFTVDATNENYTFTPESVFDADKTNRFDGEAVVLSGNADDGLTITDYYSEFIDVNMPEAVRYSLRDADDVEVGVAVVPLYRSTASGRVMMDPANNIEGYTAADIANDAAHEKNYQKTVRVDVAHADIDGLSGIKVYRNHEVVGNAGATDEYVDVTVEKLDQSSVFESELVVASQYGENTYGSPKATVHAALVTLTVHDKGGSKYAFTTADGKTGHYFSALIDATLETPEDEFELVGIRAWRTCNSSAEPIQEFEGRSSDYNFATILDTNNFAAIEGNEVKNIGNELITYKDAAGTLFQFTSGVFGSFEKMPTVSWRVRAYYRRIPQSSSAPMMKAPAAEMYYVAEDFVEVKFTAADIETGILDVFGAKEVKSVRYFNIMGVESAEPVDGVNIVVTTYTDGTSSSAKMLR